MKRGTGGVPYPLFPLVGRGSRLLRQQEHLHEAGRLVHLVLAQDVGIALRSLLALAGARIATRSVLDAGADGAAEREDAEDLLIAQLAHWWAELRRVAA